MGNVTTSHSFNQFSFDIQTVLDDDRQRILKKYRDIKKKIKVLFRRQADEQGFVFVFLSKCFFFVHFQF